VLELDVPAPEITRALHVTAGEDDGSGLPATVAGWAMVRLVEDDQLPRWCSGGVAAVREPSAVGACARDELRNVRELHQCPY